MNVAEEIKNLINEALKKLNVSAMDVELEHPADLTHGDYSTNVAMVLAKKLGKNPKEIAEEITRTLPDNVLVAKVEVAGPGFINFHLSGEFFVGSVQDVLKKGQKWGSGDSFKGKKVMVEYTDPNPFKEIHIGHLVPNSIGVALARTLQASGAKVREVTFQGDVGMHVAKAVYGMQKLGLTVGGEFTATDLGKAYAVGATAFEEENSAKEEITELNKRIYGIYKGEETELKELYEKGKEVSVKYFEEVYKLLNSNFSHYFFESETGPVGAEIVHKHIGTVFEESDGAVVFKGEKYGLHTRVFINAEGLPTYEAKDVGLAELKHEWWPHDISITITGGEQETYFHVVQKAIELIDPERAGAMHLVVNGMLDLANGKMSSRTGDAIRAVDLVDDVKKVVQEKMEDASDEQVKDVAVGAIKYSVLRSGTRRDITFDFDKSISLEGDSGPYLQYTYARCKSVLRNTSECSRGPLEHSLVHADTVEKLLYRFPEVVERAAKEHEPHYVANYLAELASAFNSWYAKEKILDGSEAQGYKLALTKSVAHTLKNGLWMLGIEAPEQM